MQLSTTVAAIAVILGAIVVAGRAFGDEIPAPAPKQITAQEKVDAREAARRAAVADQQKRKEDFARACNKPLKTQTERDLCRTAYKRLELAE